LLPSVLVVLCLQVTLVLVRPHSYIGTQMAHSTANLYQQSGSTFEKNVLYVNCWSDCYCLKLPVFYIDPLTLRLLWSVVYGCMLTVNSGRYVIVMLSLSVFACKKINIQLNSKSLFSAVCFKHHSNVCACAVIASTNSGLNLSPEMNSATPISCNLQTFRLWTSV